MTGSGTAAVGWRGLVLWGVVRLALDVFIGVAIGLGVWACDVLANGHTFGDAIAGRVEDSLSLAGTLSLLGGMVGFAVGVLHGMDYVVSNRRLTDSGKR